MEMREENKSLEILDESSNPSLTLIRAANDCMEGAINEPELKPLFGTLWQTG
jgi:hypothetical protein